jgi:rare lipoprotein A
VIGSNFVEVYLMPEVILKYFTPFLLILITIGCSSGNLYETKGISRKKLHNKFGNTQTGTQLKEVTKGQVYYFVCSYYGKKFHGRQTANGEIFDMYKLSCAHKSLPFGTQLKVINEDNGKSVVVRVNDRGPFIEGRDLDLSYAAAQEIGLIAHGVKKMRVEVLGTN